MMHLPGRNVADWVGEQLTMANVMAALALLVAVAAAIFTRQSARSAKESAAAAERSADATERQADTAVKSEELARRQLALAHRQRMDELTPKVYLTVDKEIDGPILSPDDLPGEHVAGGTWLDAYDHDFVQIGYRVRVTMLNSGQHPVHVLPLAGIRWLDDGGCSMPGIVEPSLVYQLEAGARARFEWNPATSLRDWMERYLSLEDLTTSVLITTGADQHPSCTHWLRLDADPVHPQTPSYRHGRVERDDVRATGFRPYVWRIAQDSPRVLLRAETRYPREDYE